MIAGFDAAALLQKGTQHRSRVAPVVLPNTPSESGGIIKIMTDFKTDILTDMTEAETEEKHAAKDYVKIMKDSQETRAADTKSLNHKKEAKASLEMKISDAKELHQLTGDEIHNLD